MESLDRASGDNITCPKCGEMIPITETIQHQLTERTRAEMKREMADEQKTLVAREKDLQAKEASLAEAERDIDAQVARRLAAEQKSLAAREKELQAQAAKLEEASLDIDAQVARKLATERKILFAKEKDLQAKTASLAESERSIDEQVSRKLSIERSALLDDARKHALDKAREEFSLRMDDLEADAAEKDRKLQEAQKKELELRKERRELEAAKQSQELDLVRQLDAEREGIRQEAMALAAQEHHLKDAEKDKKISDALRTNEELNRKLQQGSQQTQGEVLELELEQVLRDCCRFDEILPVPKGVRGADVLQKVNNRLGCCGLIIWEAKHTKNWSDGWIAKLKEDQQSAHADVAVLVTDVLPKEIDHFGRQDSVWVTSPRYVPGLVAVLRPWIEEVEKTKRAAAGKNETVEALFNYITGPDFANHVEGIMRGFIGMRETLEEEKRTTRRRWAKREKQLDRCVADTIGMHGDFQGLLGTSLHPILALDSGDGDSAEQVGLAFAAEAEDVAS